MGTESGYWGIVDYINGQVPPQAKLLLVGTATWGFFLRGRDYVSDTYGDWFLIL